MKPSEWIEARTQFILGQVGVRAALKGQPVDMMAIRMRAMIDFLDVMFSEAQKEEESGSVTSNNLNGSPVVSG